MDDHSWCKLHSGILLLWCRHPGWNSACLSFSPLTISSILMTSSDVDVYTVKVTHLMRRIPHTISKVMFRLEES